MAHLIDKAAVVAEIDRRIKVLQEHPYENHKTICHLDSLKQSLDTLEVKEINSTDAFIKKACAYLDSIGHRYIIDAFRKYMEKE